MLKMNLYASCGCGVLSIDQCSVSVVHTARTNFDGVQMWPCLNADAWNPDIQSGGPGWWDEMLYILHFQGFRLSWAISPENKNG